MIKRERPIKAMTKEQAQRLREARVYESMARFCKLGKGLGSVTISAGGQSFTINAENSPRMIRSAKAAAALLRGDAE